MKKFSELNNDNTNKSALTSNNTNDFIKNLVNESLTVEDGNINGKDELVNTLVKMFNMNENKAVLKTLESVKLNSYKHLNMTWINESIDTQRSIINGEDNQELITESVDETLIATKKEVKDEIITESKEETEGCDCEQEDCKCKPEEDEEEKTDVENDEEETEVNETTQSIVNKINWINRNDIIAYVENAGYALYNNESEDELKAILLEAVQNGEVELNDINESFVTKEKYVVNRENEKLFNIYESIVNESDNTETEKDNTELNFKTFKEMFGAQMNHLDEGKGYIYDYVGEELNYCESKIFENKVASIIKKDGIKTLVSGFKTEDRVGYIVTEQPIEESLEINLKR